MDHSQQDRRVANGNFLVRLYKEFAPGLLVLSVLAVIIWFFMLSGKYTLNYFMADFDESVNHRLTAEYYDRLQSLGVKEIEYWTGYGVLCSGSCLHAGEVAGDFATGKPVGFGDIGDWSKPDTYWDSGFNKETYIKITETGIEYRGHISDKRCVKESRQECLYQGASMILNRVLFELEKYRGK